MKFHDSNYKRRSNILSYYTEEQNQQFLNNPFYIRVKRRKVLISFLNLDTFEQTIFEINRA